MDFTQYLNGTKIVLNYKIVELNNFENGFCIKIKIELIDNSFLFVTEYLDEFERNYSYHWQDKNNQLITRWDNTPYHKDIETFPHHQHNKYGIFESYMISFDDILKHIEKIIL